MQASILECNNEELQQCGRRCCLRIEGVPSVENESSDDVLGKVKSLIMEFGCEIPDVVIDRAHRIGRGYQDKTRNVPCKTIIFSDCNWTRTQNHLVLKRTLNHLAKLATIECGFRQL